MKTAKILGFLAGVLAVWSLASAATVDIGSGYAEGDPAPYADTVYVRGGFNGWGLTNPMTWDGSAYSATIFLAAGDYEFKIADEGWNNPNFGPDFGAGGDPVVVLGTPASVAQAPGANLVLSITTDSTYLFSMYNVAPDVLSATLLVTKVPIPAAFLLFGSALMGLGVVRRRKS